MGRSIEDFRTYLYQDRVKMNLFLYYSFVLLIKRNSVYSRIASAYLYTKQLERSFFSHLLVYRD